MRPLARYVAFATVLLAPAGAAIAQYNFEVVHAFDAAGPGGRVPMASLLEAPDGSFYGTTANGGARDVGVVFQIRPDRTIVTRDLQGATTGKNPYAALIQTSDGTLYGTTKNGGANFSGTFFAIAPSGLFTTFDLPGVIRCTGSVGPAPGPVVPLTRGADGNLYSAVYGGGISPCLFIPGAVVRLTPAGEVTRFTAPFVLSGLNGALVAAADGFLYGPASGLFGTFAYKFSSGQFTEVHTFATSEGAGPSAFVQAPDLNFYATAAGGGAFGKGTIFRMSPAGVVTVLHDFEGGADGAAPTAGLVLGLDSALYGVTSKGGPADAGTIFRITRGGVYDVLYAFTGGADGGAPQAALIAGKDGSLYGTASAGGPLGGGVVFRIKAPGSQPLLIIDAPGADAIVPTSFDMSGWSLDYGAFNGTGIDAIHVYAFPNPGSGAAPVFLGVAAYGQARPDLGFLLGAQFANTGFSLTVPYLAPGPYLLAALGRSTVTATFSAVATRQVTVAGPQSRPFIALDVPTSDATVTGQLTASGWAIDAGATSGTGVSAIHVWAVPEDGSAARFLGVASYGLSRPDVGAIIGSQFTNSGFAITASLPQGKYTIAAFAWSTVAGAFNNMRLATNVTVQ